LKSDEVLVAVPFALFCVKFAYCNLDGGSKGAIFCIFPFLRLGWASEKSVSERKIRTKIENEKWWFAMSGTKNERL